VIALIITAAAVLCVVPLIVFAWAMSRMAALSDMDAQRLQDERRTP
jgi:hypothetical protein